MISSHRNLTNGSYFAGHLHEMLFPDHTTHYHTGESPSRIFATQANSSSSSHHPAEVRNVNDLYRLRLLFVRNKLLKKKVRWKECGRARGKEHIGAHGGSSAPSPKLHPIRDNRRGVTKCTARSCKLKVLAYAKLCATLLRMCMCSTIL